MKEQATGNRTLTLVLMIVVVGLLNADQNLINSTLGAAAFWIPCGILLLVAAAVFGGDIKELQRRMTEVAREMKAGAGGRKRAGGGAKKT